jgi:paraquat-inducible protein B
MNEKVPRRPEPVDFAEPVIETRRRSISLVWVVPIVAVFIGAWLIYRAQMEKGPEITITFSSAEGLEAGKTKVKFKDVDIGLVDEIMIGKDLRHVVVKAQIDKDAAPYLTETTRFWVVRARISAGAVYGLGTVLSGAYIDMDPGSPGKDARHFKGLEAPPVVTTGLPGGHFTLQSDRKGSLEIGSPVYYKQIRAGEVVAFHLSEDGTKVVFKVFLHAPYHDYVRKSTRFWNASGLDLRLDAGGVRLDTESFVSIVLGGIAFGMTDDMEMSGEPASEDEVFTLFPNRETAQTRSYFVKNYWIVRFDESVRGLSVGAPVEFRGMQIGVVSDISIAFDPERQAFDIPILIGVEPGRILTRDQGQAVLDRERFMDYLVERGLRAQLRMGSILTGQKYVALDFFPKAPPAQIAREGKHPEIPTIRAPLEEIGTKVTGLLAKLDEFPIEQMGTKVIELLVKLDKFPIEQLGNDLRDAVQGAKDLTTSPELVETVRALNEAVVELKGLTASLRTTVAPELSATLDRIRRSLDTVEETMGSDSELQSNVKETLTELGAAARALRFLADYLERHPEALIRGKGKVE